ncbi:hypothetical protein [Sinosporangium siamense]|nr:hypothetical protein [Sinosporangium siamense]
MVLLVSAACSGEAAPKPVLPPPKAVVYTLLVSNELLAVDVDRGVVIRRRMAEYDGEAYPAYAITASPDRKTLHVLTQREWFPQEAGKRERQSIVLVDPTSLEVRKRILLDGAWTNVVMVAGRRTGRLHVFGMAKERGGWAPTLTVVDPVEGSVVSRVKLRAAHGKTWLPFAADLSDDERRVTLSYHGEDTTGSEVYRIGGDGRGERLAASDRLTGCTGAAGEGRCVDLHGGVSTHKGRLYATTGGPEVMEIDVDGRLLRRLALPSLQGNHVMEMVLNREAGRLYVLGSCLYSGGLAVLDLADGRSREVAPRKRGTGTAGPDLVCGERGELYSDALITMLKPADEVVFVDTVTGKIHKRVHVDRRPVSLLVLPL